jgi:curli biogenesis system outer membrane secretion channel CsgG
VKRPALALGIASLLAGSTAGCALTPATLKLGYDDAKAARGPLATVQPLHVEVGTFVDKRPETDKIGYKRNGFGQKTANISSAKPVPDIIQEALTAEFTRNGHLKAAERKDLVLSGEVTTFWFDSQVNFWTVEFMGTVAITMNVVDGKTGAVVLIRSYQGHYNEKSGGGWTGTWERVMNTALERMLHEIGTDPKLLQALKSL